ncbi:MAG: VWA domain-containing protein [Terracidiphilus sp.]
MSCLRGIAVFLPVLLLAPAGWAQLAPSPDAPPVSTAPVVPTPEPAPALKMNVNLVDVFFTVRDGNGRLVAHLTRNDCTVAEDQVPQTLSSFTEETDLPLTLGILVDTSGSQNRLLPLEQQIGARFLRRVVRPRDEAFLLSFDVNVNLLQDLTSDPDLLVSALDRAAINTAGGNGAAGLPGAGGGTVPTIGAPRGTLLYDAVYQAIRDKMRQETGRKAILLLTDGQDEGSTTKIGAAIAAAQRSNVALYAILVADRGFYGAFDYSGSAALKRMTRETGGRLINVGNNRKKLQAAFQQIEDELRSQYVASYVPANPRMDGSFRKLSVVCRGNGLKVQVRSGYFAVPAQD